MAQSLDARPRPSNLATLSVEGRNDRSRRLGRERSISSASSTSARQYADYISSHAEILTGEYLFATPNLANLARFLCRPYQIYEGGVDWKDGEDSFASLYHLGSESPNQPFHFNDPATFERLMTQEATRDSSLLLFLRGYPSPTWLNSIGSTCNIDPEFFHRHLSFWSTAGQEESFPFPALPSSSSNIVRLHLATIGSREDSGKGVRQDKIASLRSKSEEQMSDYQHNLRSFRGFRTGNSIIRHFEIHDEKHFSLEQDVSICVNRMGKGWITIVWLDVGNDLRLIPNSPLLEAVSPCAKLHRVFLRKPRTAWKAEPSTPSPRSLNPRTNAIQSAALLHLEYGKHLNHELAALDPFYALKDIFDFIACSQRTLQNMMSAKLAAELDALDLGGETPSLSNLIHSKQVLDRQIDNLKENIAAIKSKGGLDEDSEETEEAWPRASEETDKILSHMSATTMLRDYVELLEQAQDLSKKCKHGMNMFMNTAMIEESKRAIRQAQGVEKLTRLAFFYIPLSFATSFFGMNVKQLNSGVLSIWIVFAFSCPVLCLSMCLLYFDIQGISLSGMQIVGKGLAELFGQLYGRFSS